MEERLAQSEKRVATEAQKQLDLELAELRERIETVQKVKKTPDLEECTAPFVYRCESSRTHVIGVVSIGSKIGFNILCESHMMRVFNCFWLIGLKARDSKEAQARQHLASLEDLRLRSVTEQRDFGRELVALGEELEKSRDAARGSEGRASKLQVYDAQLVGAGGNTPILAGRKQ